VFTICPAGYNYGNVSFNDAQHIYKGKGAQCVYHDDINKNGSSCPVEFKVIDPDGNGPDEERRCVVFNGGNPAGRKLAQQICQLSNLET
jgi:hypothetical protein